MSFDTPTPTPNQAFALTTREAFECTEAGLKKEIARWHLLGAGCAERDGDEVAWILEIDRAARALA